MAKKKHKNKKPSEKWKKYKIQGDKLIKSPSCPKCGNGVFLAQHKDRLYCGSCHYVQYQK